MCCNLLQIFGVKGLSVLHGYMRIPEGCPVDYTHCILQGNCCVYGGCPSVCKIVCRHTKNVFYCFYNLL